MVSTELVSTQQNAHLQAGARRFGFVSGSLGEGAVPELATSAQQGELSDSPRAVNGLFREAALTYLAAPDQIDTLMAADHATILAGAR